jgi:hypothetical protein
VDIAVDPANCGACGEICAAGEVCSTGQCGVTCTGGTTSCSGKCVDIAVDPANCGACGNACQGGNTCQNGQCGLVCSGGTTSCAGQCVDLQVDPNNCGSCGNACPSGQTCQAGGCTLVCPGGMTNCGGQCVNTATDSQNCGSCGQQCGSGEVCQSGSCTLTCNPNQSISPGATATSSGGGGTTTGPAQMNDGHLEAECGTYKFHWVSAGSSPASQWIQLDWPSSVTVARIAIDTTLSSNNGCGVNDGRSLAGGTIQWWSGSDWQNAGTVSGQSNDWSFTLPSPVTTTRIRIYGVHASSNGGQESNPVIFEWSVFSC